MINKKLLMAAVILLPACSTVTTGTSQPFAVKTAEVDGAKCELVDSKDARWVIPETPGTVEITKGDGPLNVTCTKSGFKDGELLVEETFAGMTAGNIILGGGIGIIVDAASGAAQEYPDEVTVWMEPKSFASKAQKDAWFEAKNAHEAKIAAEKAQTEKDLNDEASYN